MNMGISNEDLEGFFGGPAFLAWYACHYDFIIVFVNV